MEYKLCDGRAESVVRVALFGFEIVGQGHFAADYSVPDSHQMNVVDAVTVAQRFAGSVGLQIVGSALFGRLGGCG